MDKLQSQCHQQGTDQDNPSDPDWDTWRRSLAYKRPMVSQDRQPSSARHAGTNYFHNDCVHKVPDYVVQSPIGRNTALV